MKNNLFKELGDTFRPQRNSESYKKQSYDRWIIFSHLNPGDALFKTYDEKINADLDYMLAEFRHVPDWFEAYKKHSRIYWDCMKFKVTQKTFKYDPLTFSKN